MRSTFISPVFFTSRMDIETVIRESQAEDLADLFDFETEVGKQQFFKQLRFFTANKDALQRRQTAIFNVQKKLSKEDKQRLCELFVEAAALEPDLKIFSEKSDVEKNSYEQLTFSSYPSVQILNTLPFVLLLLSIFKLYIVPGMALLTPFFMICMPYFILTYWYNLPLSFSQYKDLMLGMMGIQSQQFWTPKNLLQVGLTTFSIVQSMVQPVQNAIHLQTINKDLVERGKKVERFAKILEEISNSIPLKNPLQDILEQSSDPHRSFGEMYDSPFRLQYALQLLGDAEVTFRLASTGMVPVVFTAKQGGLSLLDGYDPLIPNSKPFTVDFHFKGNHHTILTGPNRGGKSSFLRGVLLNVVLAQTFGFCFARACLLQPFNWIATGLKLEDRPGKNSMFEREVEFAVSILQRAKHKKDEIGLVLFDELFHSTNPPDGTRTAKLFLEKLWKQQNIISIISTHVFEIAKKAPENIKRMCVPAEKKENGSLEFTYKLQEGVCEVSSVDLILGEKGLLKAA